MPTLGHSVPILCVGTGREQDLPCCMPKTLLECRRTWSKGRHYSNSELPVPCSISEHSNIPRNIDIPRNICGILRDPPEYSRGTP